MSVYVNSGLWTTIWRNKKASTALVGNEFVILDAGYVNAASTDAGAVNKPILGVLEGPVVASDTIGTYLYSNTALVPVQVPIGPATVRATATNTLAKADEGKQLDLSDAVTVNHSGVTYGPVTCVKFISTTEGIFAISKSVYANVA